MVKNTGFSIIVPTYNTYEPYLRDCMNALVGLKYDNFEIIVIDDGSDTKTKNILEEYNSYPFLFIQHQQNKGISASRFAGIRMAKKDYIIFVDSDDIININSLDILNNIIKVNNPDFILHTAPRFINNINDSIEEEHIFPEGIVKKEDILREILYFHMNGIGNVCGKRTLYKGMEDNIDFSIINGEDLQQTSYLALKSSIFYYTKQPLDYYRFNEKQRTYYDVKKINESNFIVPTYRMFFVNNDKFDEYLPIYKDSAIKAIIYIAFQICWLNLKPLERNKYLNELNNQECISIIKTINKKCSIISETLFYILISKHYFIFNLIAKLYKLIIY